MRGEEKIAGGEVLAERSKWVVVSFITLLILLPIVAFLCAAALLFPWEFSTRIMAVLTVIVTIIGLIVSIYEVSTIPVTMVVYRAGKFYFYPKKGIEVVLLTQDVGSVSRRHYDGRRNRYASREGKLIVSYRGGVMEFRHVTNVEYAEKRISEIKQDYREEQLREELRADMSEYD
ncbi:MAG: hypothetical protein DBX59_04350 [Bacillota bacterium]|nr:MAG: hypothetical protein DBX59_04350 [Bacillota bacterium]